MNKSNSSCHPSIRPRHRQNIRKKILFQRKVLAFDKKNLPRRISREKLHILKKTLFKLLLLDQLKKFSHRKLCKNLYNVRQVKMIELLVSCSAQEREREKGIGQASAPAVATESCACSHSQCCTLSKNPRKLI